MPVFIEEEEDEMPAVAMLQPHRTLHHIFPRRPRPALRDVSRGDPTSWLYKLQEPSLTDDLDAGALSQVEALATGRIRLRKGEPLFRTGAPFTSLYAIRTGSCKTVSLSEDGHDQVGGYHMSGEILGADGIGSGSYGCEAIALEDTEVVVLPFDRIEALTRQNGPFQRNLYRLLSCEIARERTVMLLLGTMRAEQRLATFLIDLAQRYQARGFSSCEFVLRMTREEIGSYLGLKLETVSRLFSRFQREGLLQVEGRVVKLLDRAAMLKLINECA